ncbi:hypothetical protein LMG6103_03014 [Achromobacter piechaudii]|nr:hypothetical protein LMG6103_03014 [Achromobacter piechaudii]
MAKSPRSTACHERPALGVRGKTAVYSTAFTMSSSTFLASPNTIIVRSM